jgi:alpha-glucosidase
LAPGFLLGIPVPYYREMNIFRDKGTYPMKKSFFYLLFAALWLAKITEAQEFVLLSPDEHIRVAVRLDDRIEFSIIQDGKEIIREVSPLLKLEAGLQLGINPWLSKESRQSRSDVLEPVVPLKSAEILDQYNELLLEFRGKYALRLRAYNNGIAYRFETGFRDEIVIGNEGMDILFGDDFTVLYPEETSLVSHYERDYLVRKISGIQDGSFCSLPVLFKTGEKSSLLITEADLYDYPGLFLERTGTGFGSKFPRYVLGSVPAEGRSGDRQEILTEAEYIARTRGTRTFPWRVFVLAEKAADLPECNLIWQLSRPLKLQETGWIRPGHVAWEWWNAWNISGVDFESGINTDTYKYYIDFAHAFGLEYMLLDEGWSKSTTNIKEPTEKLDLEELIRYGKERGVGLILWTLWKPLDRDMDAILDLYRDWGIKGIKVDFMQRADQYMVNYYERVAREAAERQLLVDFHGAFKPAGLRRAYPNLVNYEGVKGMEHNKWSPDITPEHDLTIPFIRMVAGPMDFTPGAMDNAQEQDFFPRYNRPMSQGTRCHQIAMYVIYEAPIQMLADNPTSYYKEEECTRFISRIPTTYDESLVLEAAVSDYLVMARRKGDAWYMGGMTDWTPRAFEINLDFLPEGTYRMEILRDGVNAEKWAGDYKRTVQTVQSGDRMQVRMAKGGGWAAILTPE